ncbi:hypothetical protein ACFL1H_06375 [Nanoarchaeota archaeon]
MKMNYSYLKRSYELKSLGLRKIGNEFYDQTGNVIDDMDTLDDFFRLTNAKLQIDEALETQLINKFNAPNKIKSNIMRQLGYNPVEGSIIEKLKIKSINKKIANGEITADLEQSVRKMWNENPSRTASLVDNTYLHDLDIGRDDFYNALERESANDKFLSALDEANVKYNLEITSGKPMLDLDEVQYIKGDYGVVIQNKNGFKKVLVKVDGEFKVVDLPDNDLQIIGGLTPEHNKATRQLFLNEIEVKTEVIGDRPMQGFFAKGYSQQETKSIDDILEKGPDYFEEQIGVSSRVSVVGEDIVDVGPPIRTNIDDENYIVREFTLKDGTKHKYPTAKILEGGEKQDILFENVLHDGRTVWSTDNIEKIVSDRIPDSIKQANLEGRVVYVMEGTKEEAGAYLKSKGYTIQSVDEITDPGVNTYKIQLSPGDLVGYNVFMATDPSGRDIYMIGNIAGESKRQRVESILVQAGFDTDKIAVVKSKRDYTDMYSKVLKQEEPDIVILGDSNQIKTIAKQYGAKIEGSQLEGGLGSVETFWIKDAKGNAQKVMFTQTPNGELAGRFTEAIASQEKNIKLGITGDSGTHSTFKELYNKLNPDNQVNVREIGTHEGYTPGKVNVDGGIVEIDNKMVRGTDPEIIEGGLKVTPDTTHGNAFATPEEDLAWMLKNIDVDTTDVEFANVVRALEKAKAERKNIDLYALFQTEDAIASGKPMGLGRNFDPNIKIEKDKYILTNILDTDNLDNVEFVGDIDISNVNKNQYLKVPTGKENNKIFAKKIKEAVIKGDIDLANPLTIDNFMREMGYPKKINPDINLLNQEGINIPSKLRGEVQKQIDTLVLDNQKIKSVEEANQWVRDNIDSLRTKVEGGGAAGIDTSVSTDPTTHVPGIVASGDVSQ